MKGDNKLRKLTCPKLIRYVGVIWVEFHVLQLLSIIFPKGKLCCMRKSMMKHQQKSD